MSRFPIHTPESAPAASREALEKIKQKYGFVPNLAAVFAEAPGTMKALLGLLGAYDSEEIGLTQAERQVVMLAVSVKNRCEYCTAAHSMLASMNGLSAEDIENLQESAPLGDSKLEALRSFTLTLANKNGWADDSDINAFLVAGYTKANVLDVIMGITVKTLTNYANHVAKPPVNEQFAQFLPKWAKAA